MDANNVRNFGDSSSRREIQYSAANKSYRPPILTIYNDNECIAKSMIKAIGGTTDVTDCASNLKNISSRGRMITKILDDESDNSVRDSFVQNNCRCCCHEQEHIDVEMTASYNWQDGFISPLQRLHTIFTLGHLTDVTITFPDCSTTFKVSSS